MTMNRPEHRPARGAAGGRGWHKEGGAGRKPYGAKKSFSKDGEHRPYGGDRPWHKKEGAASHEGRDFGARKPFSKYGGSSEGRKPYGEKRTWHKKDDAGFSGERKSFGKPAGRYEDRKPYGEKRTWHKDDAGFRGERKSFGKSEGRYEGRKPYGERPRYKSEGGEGRGYEGKPFGNRAYSGGRGGKPRFEKQGARPHTPTIRMEKQPKFEQQIVTERFVRQGRCIAFGHHDEKVFFTDYALPGESLVVLAEKVPGPKEIYDAVPKEVLKAAEGRTKPQCPLHFKPGKTHWCGGCDMGHATYPAQLEAKMAIVRDSLAHHGMRHTRIEPVIPSPQIWHYRNKMQVPFAPRGTRIISGFFHPGTHDIVPFDDCPVQSELSMKVLNHVRAEAARAGWEIYDEKTHRGWLKYVFVRTTESGEAQLTFVSRMRPDIDNYVKKLCASMPEVASVYVNIQPEHTSVILGPKWELLAGKPLMTETICGIDFLFYPGSFMQVNTPATEKLYGVVTDFLSRGRPAHDLYDMYCGVGTIGMIAAKDFQHVTGIEENAGAIACAWKTAQKNKIKNIRFLAGRSEEIFSRYLARNLDKDSAVVVDPPRTGCAESLLKRIAHHSVVKIVYVSCNPDTLGRDARYLCENGYRLSRVQPVDLFPQTAHIETVALFERAQADFRPGKIYNASNSQRREFHAKRPSFKNKRV